MLSGMGGAGIFLLGFVFGVVFIILSMIAFKIEVKVEDDRRERKDDE
jgi:hypothetical protein